MSWHHDAFCDWQPIGAHSTQPCKGGCGTHVDAADGLCLKCRMGLPKGCDCRYLNGKLYDNSDCRIHGGRK